MTDYSKINRPKLPSVVHLEGKQKEDFIRRMREQFAKVTIKRPKSVGCGPCAGLA